jgi:hypothetical protein
MYSLITNVLQDEANERAMCDLMAENKRLADQVRNVLKSEQAALERLGNTPMQVCTYSTV